MFDSILAKDRNLFVRLYKYRPDRLHTPQENFVTECFAINLSIDRKLLSEFFKRYLREDLPDGLHIDTQVKYENGIFDIVFTNDKDFYYVAECKMNAGFSQHPEDEAKDQLDKYAEKIQTLGADNKGIFIITVRNPPAREYQHLKYVALRWIDIKTFFEAFSSDNPVAEILRRQFVELLGFLKVDRTLRNNRLLWKCDFCGLETIGQGIFSHQKRHCGEYAHIIQDENQNRREEFLKRIKPYEVDIESILVEVRKLEKVEVRNYGDREWVFELLKNSNLPESLWLFVIGKLGFGFSNKAFQKFQTEVKMRLSDVQFEREPEYISNTYENLLLFKGRLP
ncbi:MAG: hypothetical protein AABO57_16460 [Acidobacteriota bacterium]